MGRRFLEFGIFIMLVILLMLGVQYARHHKQNFNVIASELSLIDVKVSTINQGTRLYEPTMEEVLKNCDYLLIGTIEEIILEGEGNSNHYNFIIEDSLIGEIDKNEIIVHGNYDIGSSYILFLSVVSSTARPYDIYVPDDHFIFKVSGGEIMRLINHWPLLEEYIAPFENEVYNNKNNFIKLFKENKTNIQNKRIEKANNEITDYGVLYENSDIVFEIKISSKEIVNQELCNPIYSIAKTYKGNAKNIRFFLPKDVEVEKSYLIFLKNADENYYRLTTRNNSIFEVNSHKYSEVVKLIID